MLAALGCGDASPAANGTAGGQGEGVLLYGCGADATTLDPADAEDGESIKAIVNLFDTLVGYPMDSAQLEPSLATHWSRSDDHLRWTFQIRQGVRFHDGTPLDAEAVVFSLARLIDPDHPERHDAKLPYGLDYQVIEKVTATGPFEVELKLKRPSGVLLRNLAMFAASIVSPTAFRSAGEEFKTRPVGTGPFRIGEWVPNERLVLEANPDHWRGPPGVAKIIFQPIAEPAARLRQLKSGAIDMADGLSIPVRKQVEEDPALRLLTAPGMNFGYFAMNTTRPPFDDVRVRRALAHAIDKRAILASAFENAGAIATTPIPPSLWGHDASLEDYRHDPAAARRLLAEAGVKPGHKVRFWAMRNSRPYMPAPEKVAAMIQQQLREVGIETEIMSPPWSQYLDQVGNGEHEACLMGWSTDNADPNNFLYSLLDPDHAHPPNASNVSFYRSEPFHQLILAAQAESDQAKRVELYRQAQRIVHDDCPMVPLVSLELAIATRANVENYRVHPTGIAFLREVRIRGE